MTATAQFQVEYNSNIIAANEYHTGKISCGIR